MTPFKKHLANWRECTRCPLHECRTKIVLWKGSHVPCDILFVGEAPGASEDVLGYPFAGPAGHLLDDILSQALGGPATAWHGFRLGFTNLVACIPLGGDGKKTAEPSQESIKACLPRLEELIMVCRPKMIVAVGKLAAKWLPKVQAVGSTPLVEIIHPSAILQADISQKGLAIQRCIVTLSDAVQDL